MRENGWLVALVALALVAPTATAHPTDALEVVPFDETIPAGAAVDGSPTSASPHGNISVPAEADLVHLRMNWTPTPGTNPVLRLTALDGSSTPFENRTIGWTVGDSSLELTVRVDDVDLLGWRVRAHEGLAADQDVEGVAEFETKPSPDPATAPAPAPAPAEPSGQPTAESPGEPISPTAAAGLAALLAGALAALRRYWDPIAGVLVGLFSRIDDDELVEHPTRRRILALVDREPGLHRAALERRTDLSEATLRHHLAKLEDADLLVRRETDGYVCYFRQGSTTAREREALARVRSPTAREILTTLHAEGSDSQRALARRLDLAPSTVNYHVRRLADADLVDREGPRGPQVTELGRRVLDRLLDR